EPADDEEDDAPRKHPEAAEGNSDLALHLAHLRAIEVSLEDSAIGLDELAQADADRRQADKHRQPAAFWVVEDRGDGLLRRVCRGTACPSGFDIAIRSASTPMTAYRAPRTT